MDVKRIILVSVVCFFAFFAIFAVQQCNADTQTSTTEEEVIEQIIETAVQNPTYVAVDNGEKAETFDIETDWLKVTFTTEGAGVSSIILKHESEENLQFMFKGENDNNAFLMYWGSDTENPVLDSYAYTVTSNSTSKSVVFTKSYVDSNGKQFKVIKTFEFRYGEYLFSVNVKIENASFDGQYAYTLAYEPQVGPDFTVMKNNNYDYRRYYVGVVKNNGKIKRTTISLKSNKFESTKTGKSDFDCDWISLTSKYFTVVARPENTDVDFKFSAYRSTDGDIVQSDGIYVSVPSSDSDNQTIYFYCGPQLKKYMGSYYNRDDNAWNLSGFNLEDAMESSSALGWLETCLKWILQVLYKVIPNYGICIIITTILIKLAMWPLQKKGMESTAKMSAINPQIQEIQAKYKDNPQKQNMAMQELYNEYDIKPLGGCLPMLIQFPILIAFYGLLNRHYELRGAMFIPGWITDLSIPETVATLSFSIPLLGNEIHLLPIIYTASMIFSMKYTQSSSQNSVSNQQKSTMWFMTWGMPIMFFFVLYSAPSGLLLYWTCQNALSILQQFRTNRKLSDGTITVQSKKDIKEKKEPAAVLKYQEKLKKLEEAKALAEKQSAKNKKKGK